MHRSKRLRFWVLLGLLLSIAATASAAIFFVTPPGSLVIPSLRTYPVTAADWERWVQPRPQATNAIFDYDGSKCAFGQPGLLGPGVWYLAGLPAAGSVERKCTVPYGRTLIIPVINTLSGAFDTDPPEEKTVAFQREQTRAVKRANNLSLSIDGQAVPNIKNYYTESDVFSLTFGEDNIYQLPANTVLYPAVDAGFYVAVSGLLPGNHIIKWHVDFSGESAQDITYLIRTSFF